MSAAPASEERRRLLGSLLGSPKLCACVLGAGVAHVGLSAAGLGGWPCPFFQATGWPCPGCGLGRACVLLLGGKWSAALLMHAFAPLLIVTLGLLGTGLLLRGRARSVLLAGVQWIEDRTRLVPALLVALFFYWALRFTLDAPGFRALVR
jgi:hypothetical protein